MRILGLIPARGGSKGIPRKNIRMVAGRPLIAWTIAAALRSTLLSAIVVTTEDAEIAEVSRSHGAQTPFMRPAELSRDETPGVAPVLHALAQLPDYDAVLLMQPTSPLRATEDIDACIRLAQESDASCVVSVCAADKHPYWMYVLDDTRRLRPFVRDKKHVTRRQDLPPVYAANGALYFAKADWLRRTRTFITPDTAAYVMPNERSVDIDSLHDLKLAELLLTEAS